MIDKFLNVWFYILIVLHIRKQKFQYIPFIHVDQDGRTCNHVTPTVRFLDSITVKAYTETDAFMQANQIADAKYPEYTDALYFW